MSAVADPAVAESAAGRRAGAQLATRGLAAAAALALALVAAWTASADARDRARLAARAAELGVGEEPLARLTRTLARESDPGERRVATAKALLTARSAADAADPARASARLAAAEEHAGEALRRLPASWEASMLLGAARFERRLHERDPRLYSAARDWEAPLTAAVERSGGSPEVEQSLARAYLEVWPALSPAKRPLVEELLRRAFAEADFRARFFARWLAVAGSLERAEALLPSDAVTAEGLAGAAWGDGDAERAVAWWRLARERRHAELERRLRAAQPAADDPAPDPAAELERVLLEAPLGLDFAPLVERAALARPAGPARAELAAAAARWLAWAEPLCLIADCPFASAAHLRLAAAARGLPDAATAFAALAGGDRAHAELVARRSEATWSEAWAPYLLLEAKSRLAAGEPAAARARLAEIHRTARARPAYAALAAEAGLPRAAGDDERLAGESWQPTAWAREPRGVRLELGVARPARGLTIELHRPAARDVVLVAEWDGAPGEPFAVLAGAGELVLDLAVAPGLHLLRLAPLAGPLPELGVTTLR